MTTALARKLADAGASPEVIALAVEAVTLASRDGDVTRHARPRDPKAADRARRYRKALKDKRNSETAKANDVAATVTAPSRDASRDGANGTDELVSKLKTSEEGRKQESKRAGDARARGIRMESGAILTEEFRHAALKLGAHGDAIPDMWAEFVDFWVAIPGQRGLKTDWLATWRNRVRDLLKKGGRNGYRTHHNGTTQTPRSGATGQDAILAGMGRLADRMRARGDAERREREAPDDGGATAGNAARLI